MKKSSLFYCIGLLISIVLLCSYTNCFDNESIVANNAPESKSYVDSFQKNSFNFLPSSTTNQIVKHDYYTLSYNEKYEQAEWVAYELKEEYLTNSNFKRPFFIQDPYVQTQSADWRNYKKSGYDKGHLCPAADMEFSLAAYNDTFFTSNISPQKHYFNGGIWSRFRK